MNTTPTPSKKLPIYVVRPKGDDTDKRLVRAPNQARVRQHISSAFEVEVASQDELIELVAAGVKVEEAEA